MVEVTEDTIHAITEMIETAEYRPTASTTVFIEDMTLAICHIDHCEYKMDGTCNHSRLAVDLTKAMLDHYAALLERKGQADAAAILRSEM